MRPRSAIALVLIAGLGLGERILLAIVSLETRTHTPIQDKLVAQRATRPRAWQRHHPDEPLPATCERDGIQELYGEISAERGAELVLASSRFGIAMFGETGSLLAFRDPSGCGGTRWIGYQEGVVVYEVLPSTCPSMMITRLQRQADTLVPVARYREEGIAERDRATNCQLLREH